VIKFSMLVWFTRNDLGQEVERESMFGQTQYSIANRWSLIAFNFCAWFDIMFCEYYSDAGYVEGFWTFLNGNIE